MKPRMAAFALGLLFWPLPAGAQGYSGVMAPQSGYHPPAQGAPDSGYGSPYSGTGTGNAGGYSSMTPKNSDAQPKEELSTVESMRGNTGAFTNSFNDKEGKGPENFYDMVEGNGSKNVGSAIDRQRREVQQRVRDAQERAQRDVERANAKREADTQAMVKRSLRDARRKAGIQDEDDEEMENEGEEMEGLSETAAPGKEEEFSQPQTVK